MKNNLIPRRHGEMTLGILGGTFNPPHLGHIILAQEIISEFNLSKLLLVPCYIPPHKMLEADPGADERLAMTELLKQYD
ncbi:MAG TPA: adenylyltransferase/cytidyltransferase family protein, partial [Spirochaetales bacterium]|nr:adenylyltransferase/cytidyltransferase family protein [Spirochaetales bacterium]